MEISSYEADLALVNYHDRKAQVNSTSLEMNKSFANGIVNKFRDFVSSNKRLNGEVIPVGSAFEGLKTHEANEFDYLFVMSEADEDAALNDHEVIKDFEQMKTDLRADDNLLNGYGVFIFTGRSNDDTRKYNRPRSATEAYGNEPLKEDWPGQYDDYPCLSASATRETLSQYIAEFVREVRQGSIQLPSVTNIEGPVIGNPAVKIVVQKNVFPPKKVSIDVSPCVRSRGSTVTYHIAKTKQALKEEAENDPRFGIPWLRTDSPYEKSKIDAKEKYEIRNLKTIKSLFKRDVHHTHIWKKILLSQSEQFPQSPTEFIEKFLDKFVGWIEVELAERLKKGSKLKGVSKLEPNYESRQLVARFNEFENILARYDDKKIVAWYQRFSFLRNLLREHKYNKFLEETVGQNWWSELL